MMSLMRGILLGALGMYFFDQRMGRRRRAKVRDKAFKYTHKVQRFVGKKSRDLRNRAHGAAIEARGAVSEVGQAIGTGASGG